MLQVPPTISSAAPADWAALSRTLAAAFADDPVFAWLIPDEERRGRALARLFAVEGRRIVLRHGRSVQATTTTTTTATATAAGSGGLPDPLGTAFVLPPGRWRTPIGVEAACAAQYVRVFGRLLPRALRVITALEKQHLREPHVYFPYIGVVPDAQGLGIGRAMVGSVLADCDRTGTPAYLEASNPRCAVLYERLGFRGTREVRPAGSPPLLLMRRDPQ